MANKRMSAEQIIVKLCEAAVLFAQGLKVSHVCRCLGVSEQTYHRWREEYEVG